MRDDFAVFILSHGRPDKIRTVKTLEKCGYTGKWYFICDNEDTTIDDYIHKFGKDKVIIFDKLYASTITDSMDSINKRNTIVYARNMCYEIAKTLNLSYFLELEDDYNLFEYRYEENDKLMTQNVTNLDSIIDCMIDYLDSTNILTVAFGQDGDLIGGKNSNLYISRVLRKAMNSFFCKVDRPFKFSGRMNDDVNTYVNLGSKGYVFLTISDIVLNQVPTQSNSSGNTDMYKEFGTYVKSFYSVMSNPSSVKISDMGHSHRRIHHLINWTNAVPKILSSKFKKYS